MLFIFLNTSAVNSEKNHILPRFQPDFESYITFYTKSLLKLIYMTINLQ